MTDPREAARLTPSEVAELRRSLRIEVWAYIDERDKQGSSERLLDRVVARVDRMLARVVPQAPDDERLDRLARELWALDEDLAQGSWAQSHAASEPYPATEYDEQDRAEYLVRARRIMAALDAAPEGGATEILDDLRRHGWTVAVHNDYRLSGEAHTFWLLTRDRECVKGEGRTDAEALKAIVYELEGRDAERAAPAPADPALRERLAQILDRRPCLEGPKYGSDNLRNWCSQWRPDMPEHWCNPCLARAALAGTRPARKPDAWLTEEKVGGEWRVFGRPHLTASMPLPVDYSDTWRVVPLYRET